METNPYYLKDTEGNYYNQYPEFQVWEDGKKAGYDKALAQLAGMTEECKQMGRQEVVEWVNKNLRDMISPTTMYESKHCLSFNNTEWQAKLKTWGIEKLP